jgi:hypothetical protein
MSKYFLPGLLPFIYYMVLFSHVCIDILLDHATIFTEPKHCITGANSRLHWIFVKCESFTS